MCHRDIKCENILIDLQNNLKIADFGFAAPHTGRNPEHLNKLTTTAGTPGQFAPEIIYQKPGKGYDGKFVDVFNAGYILFCMLFQRQPFCNATQKDPLYVYIWND